VDLGGNSLGDGGAIALGTMIHLSRSLTDLHLDYNSIGIVGAQALALSLGCELSDGNGDTIATDTIADMASSWNDETTLALDCAAAPSRGSCNFSLTNLWLHGNELIGPELEATIAKALRRNSERLPRLLTAALQRLAAAAALLPAGRFKRRQASSLPVTLATAVANHPILRNLSAQGLNNRRVTQGWAWRRTQSLCNAACEQLLAAHLHLCGDGDDKGSDVDTLTELVVAAQEALFRLLPPLGSALPDRQQLANRKRPRQLTGATAKMEDEAPIASCKRNGVHTAEPPLPLLSLADRIANVSLEEYHRRFPGHAATVRGQSVLAAFVLEEESTANLWTLSLGVGTKFLAPEVAASVQGQEGLLVRDSHAEVLARRALQRFLYAEIGRVCDGTVGGDAGEQIGAAAPSPPPIILCRGSSGKCELRTGLRLHLYTSTAPCGNASWPALDCQPLDRWACRPVNLKGAMGGVSVDSGTSHAAAPGSHRPSSNETWAGPSSRCCLTCSDKISRWARCGVQGALLSHFLEGPLRLTSVAIGRKFVERRAAWALAARPWPLPGPSLRETDGCHPLVSGTQLLLERVHDIQSGGNADRARTESGDGDECLCWAVRGLGANDSNALGACVSRHDGRTGLGITVSGGVGGQAKVCRAAMLKMWRNIVTQSCGGWLQSHRAFVGMAQEDFKFTAHYTSLKREAPVWYRELRGAWLQEMGHTTEDEGGQSESG
jgi:hypothetical protein